MHHASYDVNQLNAARSAECM